MNLFKKYQLSSNKKYANFLPRLLASLIDKLLLSLPFILSIWLLAKKDSWEEIFALGISLLALVIFPSALLSLVYYPFFLSRFGKTIGKAVLGISVADEGKKLLNFKDALFREYICKPVSLSLFGFGFVTMLFDKDHQAWHDKLVGTYVYTEANKISAGVITLFLLLIAYVYFFWQIIGRVLLFFAN